MNTATAEGRKAIVKKLLINARALEVVHSPDLSVENFSEWIRTGAARYRPQFSFVVIDPNQGLVLQKTGMAIFSGLLVDPEREADSPGLGLLANAEQYGAQPVAPPNCPDEEMAIVGVRRPSHFFIHAVDPKLDRRPSVEIVFLFAGSEISETNGAELVPYPVAMASDRDPFEITVLRHSLFAFSPVPSVADPEEFGRRLQEVKLRSDA